MRSDVKELAAAPSVLAIQPDTSLFREIDRGSSRLGRVGEEHILPAAARQGDPARRSPVGEQLEEHLRLDRAFDLRGDLAVGDLAERLIGGGKRDDRLVAGKTVAATEKSRIGRSSRVRLTPHACIATNSRSADRRPNPIRMPRSTDIGMVRLSDSAAASGSRAELSRTPTPLAMSASP